MTAAWHRDRSTRRCILPLVAALVLGTFAGKAAEPKVIALPPFLVEEKTNALPWRFAEVAGWEVLSTCPDRFTRTLIANHHRLHVLLGEMLPPALRFSTTEKQTLLFVDSAHQP